MSGVLGQVIGTAQGIGGLARGVGALLGDLGLGGGYGRVGPGLGAWAAGLQPASWRGNTFAVRSSNIRRGRRVAVHEYPFRDDVWVEDLGRGTRTISFTGFVAGPNCYARRDALVAAAETAGPGPLVHPSLGPITASCIECSAGEDATRGGVVAIEFAFIESSNGPIFPAISAAIGQLGGNAAAAGQLSFLGDFGKSVSSGIATVGSAIKTVSGYVSYAQRLGNDASLVVHAVTGLAGNFGRYSGGGRSGLQAATATVSSALGAVTTARTAIAGASSAANSLVALL